MSERRINLEAAIGCQQCAAEEYRAAIAFRLKGKDEITHQCAESASLWARDARIHMGIQDPPTHDELVIWALRDENRRMRKRLEYIASIAGRI